MNTRFQIPLRFSPRSCDPSSIGASPASLEYRLETAGKLQRRFAGRVTIAPLIDLATYKRRAVIDWIWLEFETMTVTQSTALRNHLRQLVGDSLLVTGSNVRLNARAIQNITGTSFRLKLQDPSATKIRVVQTAIEAYRGLRGPIKVIGIEIALDWYPHDRSDPARWKMVAALQRHHLPLIGGLDAAMDDLRQIYPYPYVKPADDGAEKSPVEFVIQDIRVVKPGNRDAGRQRSDLALGEQAVRRRIMRTDGHKAPYIDSTVVRGRSGGEVMYRIQNKVTDRRNPAAGTVSELPPEERRARIEVTLLGSALAGVGLNALEDLYGFDFRGLRKDHFQFWLPTTPNDSEDGAPITKMIAKHYGNVERRLFVESGVYGVHLYEAARRADSAARIRALRASGEKTPPRPRIRVGKAGGLLAWNEMNKCAGDALDLLSAQWLPHSGFHEVAAA